MNRKKITVYLIGVLSVTFILLAFSFLSYKIALYRFNSQAVENGNSPYYSADKNISITTEYVTIKQIESTTQVTTDKEVVEVAVPKENIISSKTIYVLENYDLANSELTKETLNIPDYLVGLNREGVLGYLDEYMSDLKLSEFEKGLTSFELISFSEKEVILRKNYNSKKVNYKYYLAVMDGFVTVFYSDLKTIYEYTDIDITTLSEDDQVQLLHGIYVKDIEELYGLLENYSS